MRDEYASGDRRWARLVDNLEAPWRSQPCDHRVVSDDEFDRWYELNTRDDDRRSPRDEVALRAWFRGLFDRCGAVSHAVFEAAARERQAATAKQAIEMVIEDLHHTTGCRPIVSVHSDPDVAISYWDLTGRLKSRRGLSRTPVDELDLFVVAAGDMLDHIRDDLNDVWPRCPGHHYGMHPGVRDQTAIWWCHYGDGHRVANIGSLARAFTPD